MRTIISKSNEKIIKVAKLREKKYRDAEHLFIADGIKLYEEALASCADIKDIFFNEKILKRYPDLQYDDRSVCVSDAVFDKISSEQSPEGILCTVSFDDSLHSKNIISPADRIFIVSSVRDPGNLGTIMRCAGAFGKYTLLLSGDCADIYNPKTVRASMGAIFRQKTVISDDLCSSIKKMSESGKKVYASVLDRNAVNVQDIIIDANTCFVVGNEGNGIAKEIVDACKNTVYIPMEKCAESLNASVAASILMWEQYKSV